MEDIQAETVISTQAGMNEDENRQKSGCQLNCRTDWRSTVRNELQIISPVELYLFTPLRNSKSFCPSGMENTLITVPCKEKKNHFKFVQCVLALVSRVQLQAENHFAVNLLPLLHSTYQHEVFMDLVGRMHLKSRKTRGRSY